MILLTRTHAVLALVVASFLIVLILLGWQVMHAWRVEVREEIRRLERENRALERRIAEQAQRPNVTNIFPEARYPVVENHIPTTNGRRTQEKIGEAVY